jgi:hypothetical protein
MNFDSEISHRQFKRPLIMTVTLLVLVLGMWIIQIRLSDINFYDALDYFNEKEHFVVIDPDIFVDRDYYEFSPARNLPEKQVRRLLVGQDAPWHCYIFINAIPVIRLFLSWNGKHAWSIRAREIIVALMLIILCCYYTQKTSYGLYKLPQKRFLMLLQVVNELRTKTKNGP